MLATICAIKLRHQIKDCHAHKPKMFRICYVLFHKRVQVFDHGIKTRESNESRGAKPRDIHCFRVF